MSTIEQQEHFQQQDTNKRLNILRGLSEHLRTVETQEQVNEFRARLEQNKKHIIQDQYESFVLEVDLRVTRDDIETQQETNDINTALELLTALNTSGCTMAKGLQAVELVLGHMGGYGLSVDIEESEGGEVVHALSLHGSVIAYIFLPCEGAECFYFEA